MSEHWITTASGRRFDFVNPKPETITLEDITTSLGHLCRWNGHLPVFYSVAQHCVEVSRLLETPRLQLLGLLHDATEAFVGDMSHPLKQLVGEPYKEVERRAFNAIWLSLGRGPAPTPKEERMVKIVDGRMLSTEAARFKPRLVSDLVANRFGLPYDDLILTPHPDPGHLYWHEWHRITAEIDDAKAA